MKINYGFVESLQELSEYVLGESKMPFIEYNEEGDWENYLPVFESQTIFYETYCCTVFGSLNCIETFEKFLYGKEPNYSERFTAVLSGLTGEKGTSPQVPLESIRHDGVVAQSILPMVRQKASFFDTTALTGSILAKGQNWLVQNDFKHEWVWSGEKPENYIELLREALKTSPIGVSVTAWHPIDGIYVSDMGGNNHWVMLYKIDDEGYPWIYDSYDQSKKKLSKDHNIRRAKRIWLNKRTVPAMQKHIVILQDILKALKIMKPTFLDVCTAALGTDASPKDEAPDELGCVNTLTELMRKVYPNTPSLLGTPKLKEYLFDGGEWYLVNNVMEPDTPKAGDIYLSVTGEGLRGTVGHCGVYMEDNTIASNNSFGRNKGKFTKNHTPSTWDKRYTVGQKMKLYIFRKLS